MWGGELYEERFVRSLLETVEGVGEEVYTTLLRIRGKVMTALDEYTFARNPIPGMSIQRQQQRQWIRTLHLLLKGVARPHNHKPSPSLPHSYSFLLPTRLSKTVISVSPTQASLRGTFLSLGMLS